MLQGLLWARAPFHQSSACKILPTSEKLSPHSSVREFDCTAGGPNAHMQKFDACGTKTPPSPHDVHFWAQNLKERRPRSNDRVPEHGVG